MAIAMGIELDSGRLFVETAYHGDGGYLYTLAHTLNPTHRILRIPSSPILTSSRLSRP
jgi:hypothetical protein